MGALPPILDCPDYVKACADPPSWMRSMVSVVIVLWVLSAGLSGCSSAPGRSQGPVPETPAGVDVATNAPATSPESIPTPAASTTGQARDRSRTSPTPSDPHPSRMQTVRPSHDPATLAGQIIAAEQVVHDRSASLADVEAAAFLQQLAYHKLVDKPSLQPFVLPRLDPATRSSAEAAVRAGTALRSLIKPQDRLPNWQIVAPAPAKELMSYYRQAETAYDVPWHYLAAIHLVETRMGRIRGTSSAGAQGPMQFLPKTWARYGQGDINSNHDAILAAARLLAAHGAPSDLRGALYRYNPSHGYVTAVEAYAVRMATDERAFPAFYHWQVLYQHVNGTLLLPVGYPTVQPEPVD